MEWYEMRKLVGVGCDWWIDRRSNWVGYVAGCPRPGASTAWQSHSD